MSNPIVLIRKIRSDAVIPRYQSDGAAAMDLSATVDEAVLLHPGERALVGTGLAMAIPDGYEGQIRPRSGLASKHGITVLNAPGTIDSDYRGEVKVLLVNMGRDAVRIEAWQRIAQLVIAPVSRVKVAEVDELPSTDRGAGGFGSTGE